jgi:hypothetical protein
MKFCSQLPIRISCYFFIVLFSAVEKRALLHDFNLECFRTYELTVGDYFVITSFLLNDYAVSIKFFSSLFTAEISVCTTVVHLVKCIGGPYATEMRRECWVS